jgi:hypothetical protein
MNKPSEKLFTQLIPKSGSIFFFLVLLILSIRRFPPNLFEANFFAEDGLVFWSNFQSEGVFSFLTPFNGYPLVGIYLLVFLAESLRFVLGGPITEAAFFLNFIGYVAWALLSFAPYVLLKKYFQSWVRLSLCLMFLFVPLDQYDFAILGVIGNLKAGFFPLSILFSLYILREESRYRRAIAYLLLVICIWTNPIAALSIVLLAKKTIFRDLLERQYALGNLLLFLFLIYQSKILFDGIPKLDGYLDEPLQVSNSLPIVSRIYFYTFIHPFYDKSNGIFTICLLFLFFAVVFKFAKRFKVEIWSIILIQLVAGVILLTQRSGLSEFFSDYNYMAPSQFFYAFNWISILLFYLFLFQEKSHFYFFRILIIGLLLIAELFPITGIDSFGGNDSMHTNLRSFEYNLQQSCAIVPHPDRVQIFPFVELKLQLDLKSICRNL